MLCIAIMSALFNGACSSSERPLLPSASNDDDVINVVAIGDESSLSFRDGITVTTSWPQIFFREAVPRSATFVNLATPRASINEARKRQTSVLASTHPTLVTIMVGYHDVGRSSGEIATDIRRLLDDVERAGADDAFIAVVPRTRPELATVSDVIAALPARHKSLTITLVDLRKLPITYLSGDREQFVPDVASQRVIANAFVAAYQRRAALTQ